jgi:hypothetical protein
MDAPIRQYVDDEAVNSSRRGIRPKREGPWEAEYALLQELGLYDQNRRRIESRDNGMKRIVTICAGVPAY